MLVAQKDAQLVHDVRDRPLGIAINAVEGRTGMGVYSRNRNPPEAAGTACAPQIGALASPIALARNRLL
jgi:hypothetical protein